MQAFDDLLARTVNSSVRFTHEHDMVPSLPLPFFGYHHFAREVWQQDLAPAGPRGAQDAPSPSDYTFRVCDGSGEDRTCHDSLCYNTVCRSLSDHLVYLGWPMYHAVDEC
jgi:hypothetical protein